jgi:LysR family transcriptional activator of nhaA
VKTFCHPLGKSGVTFCASPALGKTITLRFPRNLHGGPLLLHTQNTAFRRDLEKWFRAAGISPEAGPASAAHARSRPSRVRERIS